MKSINRDANKRRTEITIETHRITVIRIKNDSPPVHCEYCQKAVSAFTPKQIAGYLQLDLTEVFQRINTKQMHLTRTDRGTALICGESLEYHRKISPEIM